MDTFLLFKAILTKVFQGSMRIFTKKLPHPDLVSLLISRLWSESFRLHISTFWNAQLPEEKEALLVTEEYQEQMSESSFLFLTLDLPTAPLYKDEKEQLIIPQVPLFNILAKFNGNTEKVHDPLHAKSNEWCHERVHKCTQEGCTTDGECVKM